MSEENLHKQKFTVEQWPTSKVTLYPTRASIFRQIEGVKLKAGLNEITISNLTSVADPDSIRVAGTTDDHPARINDLTIDLVPNTTSLEPDYSDSESDDEDEDDEEPVSLKQATEAVDKVIATILEVDERRSSAREELSMIGKYANTMASNNTSSNIPDPKLMKETLELYNNQRAVLYDTITSCDKQLTELGKERDKLRKILAKEEKAWIKSLRGKMEERRKKQEAKEEKRQEKRETKPVRSSYVYRVRITIELPSSDVTVQEGSAEAGEVFQEANLNLTYTTASASWTPHYDLRLDTTNPSLSTLTYRAHFTNQTYETWSNAALTLSTSQASFGGLKEKIPQMQGWRVTLAKKWNTGPGENGLYSLAEIKAKEEAEQKEYGRDIGALRREADKAKPMLRSGLNKSKQRTASSASRAPAPSGYSSATPTANHSRPMWGHGAYQSAAAQLEDKDEEECDDDMGFGLFDGGEGGGGNEGDEVTLAVGGKAIKHSLAGSDTYGFTTTYELPTLRTIPSSPLVRRHVIAELPLPSLVFTHIVIPKLKAAAFLKARLTNTSSIPLLPGQAGMTLDGSFMGDLSFPRCSPTETVVLELGVDQGVKVEYERPTVKHGTQGMIMLGKEEVGAYNRTIRITNSKSSIVSLVVLDQVPVPEDERLKVIITNPRGLKDVDDVAKTNVGIDGKTTVKGAKAVTAAPIPPPQTKLDNISETASVKNKTFSFGKRDSTFGSISKATPPSPAPVPVAGSSNANSKSQVGWGSAKATLKKNGEVRWDVDLNKAGCVALGLEWECRMPSGEGVTAIS